MAQKKLTDTVIRNLPHPDSGNVKYWDTATAGFGVRVTAKSRSFIVMFGQDRRLKTLGKYPNISLSDARKEAKQYHQREIWWCQVGLNVGSEVDEKGEKFVCPILVFRTFTNRLMWVFHLHRSLGRVVK